MTLEMRVQAMRQLALELTNGGSWEDFAGYSLNDELLPFMNLTEELKIG